MYWHHDRWHDGTPLFVHWLFPLLFLAAMALLVVWAVRRLSAAPPATTAVPATPATPAVPPAGSRPDAALESVRMRYARGEIDRDEYLRLVTDLGGSAGDVPSGP